MHKKLYAEPLGRIEFNWSKEEDEARDNLRESLLKRSAVASSYEYAILGRMYGWLCSISFLRRLHFLQKEFDTTTITVPVLITTKKDKKSSPSQYTDDDMLGPPAGCLDRPSGRMYSI